MSDRQTPVIVGVAQLRRRPALDGPSEPIEPIQMMVQAARQAAQDAGDPALSTGADYIGTVPTMSWAYEDAPARLSGLLGANPGISHQPVPGGSSPLVLLHHAAAAIACGDVKVAVLAGAETFHSQQQAVKEGFSLEHWTPPPDPPIDPVMRGLPSMTSPLEMRHGIFLPADVFSLFENAQRAHSDRSIQEHQAYLGQLMARFSRVAAHNPSAWFPEERTAQDFSTVNPANRWINFPYPKLMNSIIMVDMAAALVVMSTEEADRRNIPRERQVAFLAGGSGSDPWTVSERSQYHSSPGSSAAANAALEQAALAAADIDLFDLYSCFPSAIQFGMDSLGLASDDPRPLTVTGGLACFGGPGNNYCTHSIAAMVERLRAGDGKVGYVSGLSMAAAKHSASIFSTDPQRIAAADGSAPEVPPALENETAPELVAAPEGAGTIETYTVTFDRENNPETSRMIVRMDDGRRTVACGEALPEDFRRLLESEGVGIRGWVSPGEGDAPNRFRMTR